MRRCSAHSIVIGRNLSRARQFCVNMATRAQEINQMVWKAATLPQEFPLKFRAYSPLLIPRRRGCESKSSAAGGSQRTEAAARLLTERGKRSYFAHVVWEKLAHITHSLVLQLVQSESTGRAFEFSYIPCLKKSPKWVIILYGKV